MSSDGPLAEDSRESDPAVNDNQSPDSGDEGEKLSERERLAGELARLETENERLRAEYARSRQAQYRQTAVALGAVGVLAAVGAVLFAGARTVLFALAGTGIFLGILTYYLAPEQFLPAAVGRDVYGAMAATHEKMVSELGLSDDRVYIPTPEGGVRLYVPQRSAGALPEGEAVEEAFVVFDGGRGLSLRPTGEGLYGEFERALSGDLAATPAETGSQLTDALVEQFELVASVEQSASGSAEEGQLTVGVVDSAYGPLDRFDHPIVSFLGVGLARALGTPVAVTVARDGNDRVDAVVTCRWTAGAAVGAVTAESADETAADESAEN